MTKHAAEHQNQPSKIKREGNILNKIASFAAAIVVVFPIALAVLLQAAHIVA